MWRFPGQHLMLLQEAKLKQSKMPGVTCLGCFQHHIGVFSNGSDAFTYPHCSGVGTAAQRPTAPHHQVSGACPGPTMSDKTPSICQFHEPGSCQRVCSPCTNLPALARKLADTTSTSLCSVAQDVHLEGSRNQCSVWGFGRYRLGTLDRGKKALNRGLLCSRKQ